MGGHSLHGWLWRALSAPMAFLVSPGQKSSLGICETGLSSAGSVLIPLLDQRCQGPGVGSEQLGGCGAQMPPSRKFFITENFKHT